MPTTIAIVQTAFLGDTALSMIFADQVRRAFPEARVLFVCRPDGESLARANPAISQVLVFDKRGRDRGLGGIFRMAIRLRQQGAEIAFCLQRSIRTALVAFASRASVRVGFDTAAGASLLTHRATYRRDQHEIERNAALIEALGIEPPAFDVPLELRLDARQQEQLAAAHQSCNGRPIVAIAPGAVWETKRWLRERFADVAERFRRDGAAVVFIGGPADAALCEQLAATTDAISLAGTLDPAATVAFLRTCSVLIANDSAPTHLATLAACPTVTIFGSTVPEFGFAPRAPGSAVAEPPALPCRPCTDHGRRRCPRGTLECMHSITAEDVFERARIAIEQRTR